MPLNSNRFSIISSLIFLRSEAGEFGPGAIVDYVTDKMNSEKFSISLSRTACFS